MGADCASPSLLRASLPGPFRVDSTKLPAPIVLVSGEETGIPVMVTVEAVGVPTALGIGTA
ncbi:MAG: hypothetical protein ACREC5_01975 [Thermoplasmata archaeon]